ncbi:metal binding domain of Ada-domain-containing protein [Aspergillus pseudonomiae]|uniref:Metal binding domain of Ada-domain-containing protein n=1 Tax=Aspergillus pseudonomiae TaxID=1506151 RepID=A0A5N7D572_9EURO|nr:metal binding domain of Ada-domain-containing protein [Aspergillus pseudonomiae]KAB8260838.1 metal binding domain of Ada-domain-containing protein [Aspergillus pseudonomiae]KAE8401484.1 metal binding domain of Ada-domain-containing protein [Aspergillus pseudonomiae]
MNQENLPLELPRLPACASPTLSATARWQAVVRRDATAESFVYAVLTTKIYCRPSCPARLARRANVQFYDTPSLAEKAGFRPCKRCKPQSLRAGNPQVQVIQRACKTIQSEIASGSKPTLRELASQACLTPSHFHRVFKKLVGVTPGQYAVAILKVAPRGPLDDCSQNTSITELKPCGVRPDDHAPFLSSGLKSDDVFDPGDIINWNDFDTLIATEAAYEAEFDVQFMDFISLPKEDAVGATEHYGQDIGDALLQHEQTSRLDGGIHLTGVETAMPS